MRGGSSLSDEPLEKPANRKLDMELAREELRTEPGTDTGPVGGVIRSGEEQTTGSSAHDRVTEGTNKRQLV